MKKDILSNVLVSKSYSPSLGFIVELTSFTSKHTSFECQIAVNESEKVVFKPFQTALMPVKAT